MINGPIIDDPKEMKDDFWKSHDTIIDGAKHLATLNSLLQGLLLAAIAFGNIQEFLKDVALFFFVFSLVLLTMSLVCSSLVFIPQKLQISPKYGNKNNLDIMLKDRRYKSIWLNRGYVFFIFASITVMVTLIFLIIQPMKSTDPLKIIIMSPTPISTSVPTLTPNPPTATMTSTTLPIVSATVTP